MNRPCIFLFLLVLAIAGSGPAFGQFGSGSQGGGVTATLIAEDEAITPGSTFSVGVLIEHTDGWHTYWRNPGVGAPTTIDWELPEGFEAGDIQWPAPELVMFSGFVTYSYEGETLLVVDITAPESLEVGSLVDLKAKVDWLQCKEVCQPGGETVTLSVPVAAEASPAPANAPLFAAARALQPKAPEAWEISAERGAGDALSLILRPTGESAVELADGDVYFYPYATLSEKTILEEETQSLSALESGEGYRLALARDPEAAELDRLAGVLVNEGGWQQDGTPVALEVDVPLEDAGAGGEAAAVIVPASTTPGGILQIVAFAFLGGLILNLMPCVFPVIGIKIMGFVNQAGEGSKKVTLHGLVFTLGILLSFWVLAGILLALRAAGDSLNWGFQLQEPIFVYALTILLFVFALNLLGVFEFGTSAIGVGSDLTARSGFAGSFFSGVLAVVVATPCSAPFLATALGAVLTLPVAQSFVVFTSMGLGLALPYLVLSAFPKLINMLPRPGAWMETFKKVMAFPLLATVAFLVWIYGGQVEAGILRDSLLALVLIAFALWLYGGWSVPSKPRRTRTSAAVAAIVLTAGGIALGYPHGKDEDDLVWEPWSAEAVAAYREEGRPVYIDFTARWCATCQTNKLAYTSEAVKAAFSEKDFVLLKADYTQKDPAISKALESYNKNAIPVNVAYLPGEDAPRILPEILTPDVVLKAIR